MTCLTKKDYVTPHDYSPKSFRVFKDLFLAVNDREGNVHIDSSSIVKQVKSTGFEGMDALWEIACQAGNSQVQERAGYLLAVMNYIYMDKKGVAGSEKETEDIVEYIIDILKQTDHEQHETLNHIKVLRQFIDAYETLDFPEHFRIFYKKLYEVEDDGEEEMMEGGFNAFINRKWNRKTHVDFAVHNTETSRCEYINIEVKAPALRLRKEIARKFGIKEREFEITYNGSSKDYIKPNYDWSYVWEIITELNSRADPEQYMDIYIVPYSEEEFRSRSISYSIAEDESYINILSNYLKNSDKATALETINVISRLPVLPNKLHEVKRYIDRHKIKKYEHWYTVLGVKFDQPEELFMQMGLLEELLRVESEHSVRNKFIDNKGINFLIDIVLQACTLLINEGKVEKFPL